MDAMLGECRSQIAGLSQGVMRSIETTRQSLDMIAGLESISASIDKIVDGISMVSIQTNMLAVNGSVEAARAGEFGKGFAVVSKDIRSLARDFSENAARIKETVRAIQGQIAAVRRELERVIGSAETENQKTDAVLAGFEIVQKDVAQIAAGNDQIATSAKAILASMKDVSQSARRSPQSPRKPPARQPRRQLLPSSRREERKISQRLSKRLPHWPKPCRAAMASRREQTRTKAHLLTDIAALVAPDTDEVLEDLLVFQLAGEPFGLRLNVVAEIIRPPALAHMPLVPPSLLGLANLRGIVMPVVSLRALLHLPDVATDRSTRVIVVRGDNPVGFVVDGIRGLWAVATDRLEKDDTGIDADGSGLLDGVIKGDEGKSPIKLLSPSRLLHGQFVRLGTPSTPTETRTSLAKSAPAGTPAKALISLLSFYLGQQEYALPIDRVREIIPLPPHVSELPRPETAVLGVVTLRDRLLPLVSLRTLLGLP